MSFLILPNTGWCQIRVPDCHGSAYMGLIGLQMPHCVVGWEHSGGSWFPDSPLIHTDGALCSSTFLEVYVPPLGAYTCIQLIMCVLVIIVARARQSNMIVYICMPFKWTQF